MICTHTIAFNNPLRGASFTRYEATISVAQQIELARKEGYERGREDAERFYNMQLVDYRKELVSLHENLGESLDREYQSMLSEFKARMPAIVVSLLKKVWSHLEWEGDDIRSMVDEALMAYAPGEAPLEVYLSPMDMTLFEEMEVKGQYGSVVFKEDLSLKQGDCLVKSRFGLLDGRLETKLRRVEAELSESI